MRPAAKRLAQWLTASAVAATMAPSTQAAPAALAVACAWPAWDAFKQTLLSDDGRVIDASSPERVTTSEGQSYALFFALVANDRTSFERVLSWTESNLAQGNLTAYLPAWIWGLRPKTGTAASDSAGSNSSVPAAPSWGVLDTNSASDADLWIAYSLLEAGRLWHDRRYTALGTLLARHLAHNETTVLPGLGRTLLPGSVGFQIDKTTWRLNPSYVPLQVMRRLADALPDAPEWAALVDSSVKQMTQTAPRGFAPDWVEYQAGRGFIPDQQTQAESAYNAIRVYLWIGTLASADPQRAALLKTYEPLADYVAAHGYPPERINTQTGELISKNAGNAGFSAAVAPYLAALGRNDLATAQVQRNRAAAAAGPLGYYSSVLTLFSLAYLDGLYRFDTTGRVVPAWTSTCPAAR